MQHMPYERMEPGDTPESVAGGGRPEDEGAPPRRAPSPEAPHGPQRTGPVEEPGRTPGSAEGLDHDEREMPAGVEPGRTPGSAEGEDTPD